MAYTAVKCRRCGQRYYQGEDHLCPPPKPQLTVAAPPSAAQLQEDWTATEALCGVFGVVGSIALLAAAANFAPELPYIPAACIGIFIAGAIGALIGSSRARPASGYLLGLLAGPLGWILILLGPDERPKCPQCLGVIPFGAKKCMHCGSDIQGPTTP